MLKRCFFTALILAVFMVSCINNKRKESVSPIVVEKDTIKESYSTWIKTDSNNTLFFTRKIDGYSVKAVIEPDTSYSPVVGHVEYHLTKNGVTSVVKTTYNHFFYYAIKGIVNPALEDTSFVGEIKADRRVPFIFCDVNFDGKINFL